MRQITTSSVAVCALALAGPAFAVCPGTVVIGDAAQGSATPALSAVSERMAVDEIDERALGMTVQVLVVR